MISAHVERKLCEDLLPPTVRWCPVYISRHLCSLELSVQVSLPVTFNLQDVVSLPIDGLAGHIIRHLTKHNPNSKHPYICCHHAKGNNQNQ